MNRLELVGVREVIVEQVMQPGLILEPQLAMTRATQIVVRRALRRSVLFDLRTAHAHSFCNA